mgnify:CR=1 FL=1
MVQQTYHTDPLKKGAKVYESKERVERLAFRTVLSVNRLIHEEKAENFVDTAIKILMAVVIGALLLAGLYKLFADTVLPTLTQRVTEMFNYSG